MTQRCAALTAQSALVGDDSSGDELDPEGSEGGTPDHSHSGAEPSTKAIHSLGSPHSPGGGEGYKPSGGGGGGSARKRGTKATKAAVRVDRRLVASFLLAYFSAPNNTGGRKEEILAVLAG